ncbi:VanW family protein [Flavobacterium ardleyense]|uniref:VanW family protein n=1 Tax=Flavobacterium ardleyense TaxID=2038737 RepID=A0ABW5Z6S3_9FLAO
MSYWKTLKLYGKITFRFTNDIVKGDFFRFTKKTTERPSFVYAINLKQEIKVNATFESKLYNFSVATQKIDKHIIRPNEIFSFWNVVGNPNKQFKKGRTIQNGKIIEEVGGGLCQVSGIIYHVSLLAGLEIVERHNHSVDIYNEETRFCPLGSDATLVYGYKDLRIRNTNSFPVKFELKVIDNMISVSLVSTIQIQENTLNFEIEQRSDYKYVTVTNQAGAVVNTSKYKNNL